MAQSYAGKWKLEKSDNLDKFLSDIKMNIIKRKIAVNIKPEIEIILTDNGFTFKSKSSVKSSENTYAWGAETEDTDPVGEKGSQVWSMEGEKMVGVFTYGNGNGKITLSRRIEGDQMTQEMVLESTGCKCVRVFRKC